MIDWFSVVFGFLAIIPFVLLMKQYLLTKINDYFYFGIAFLTFSLIGLIPVLTGINSQTGYSSEYSEIWYLLNVSFIFFLAFTSWYYMFLIGYRSLYDRDKNWLFYSVTVFYLFCIIILIFLRIAAIPQSSKFLLMNTNMLELETTNIGAYYSWGNFLCVGSGYPLLFILFKMTCAGIFLTISARIPNIASYEKFNHGKTLWVACMSGYILSQLVLLLEIFMVTSKLGVLYNIFRMISVFILFYISLYMPEGFLLSRVQILRALETYDGNKVILDGVSRGFLYDKTAEYLQYVSQNLYE